ncbi:gag-pol polyprotein [Trifolium medium]|uniref:Gag-pol polyprotein n=1 Tax=Trifolium medium TaxID=97028 RepID=A0A392R6A1_9FABA|nr:gag-pol polyprotein [Trifolium medium]
MMESINVVIDDLPTDSVTNVEPDVETFIQQTENSEDEENSESNIERTSSESGNSQANKGPSIRIQKNHPKELIIGNPDQGVTTRSRDMVTNSCFVSKFEPKNVKEALTDEFWINAMQEELGQFKRNEV